MKRKQMATLVSAVVLVGLMTILVNCGGGGGGSSSGNNTNNNTNNSTTANTNTTSGGVGVVSVNGRTVAFIPGLGGLIPVIVDGTGAAKPSLKTAGVVRPAGTTATFDMDSCSVDAVDWKVVCVGYASSKVAVFDIAAYVSSFNAADIAVTEHDLATSVSPTYVIPTISFSGGSCQNCGVAADPGEHRYIVASGDGYRVMPYTSGTPLAYYGIPISENFGFDPENNWLLAPEYQAGLPFTAATGSTVTQDMTFRIVNIGTGKTYSWDKKMACADIDPVNCWSWETTDSISIDPVTKIATMGEEWTQAFLFVDLGQASFNDTTNTFTAPFSYLGLTDVANSNLWLTTGTAVEPLSHMLLIAEELGSGIGVLQLPTASGAGNAFPSPAPWSYNSMLMPSNNVCGTGYSWGGFGDPHGLAIFTSQASGKPMGLLLDYSKQCAAVVDMKDFLAAAKSTNAGETNIVSASTPTTFLRFIKTQ